MTLPSFDWRTAFYEWNQLKDVQQWLYRNKIFNLTSSASCIVVVRLMVLAVLLAGQTWFIRNMGNGNRWFWVSKTFIRRRCMAHGPVISHIAVIVISFFRTMDEPKEFHEIRVFGQFCCCNCLWLSLAQDKWTQSNETLYCRRIKWTFSLLARGETTLLAKKHDELVVKALRVVTRNKTVINNCSIFNVLPFVTTQPSPCVVPADDWAFFFLFHFNYDVWLVDGMGDYIVFAQHNFQLPDDDEIVVELTSLMHFAKMKRLICSFGTVIWHEQPRCNRFNNGICQSWPHLRWSSSSSLMTTPCQLSHKFIYLNRETREFTWRRPTTVIILVHFESCQSIDSSNWSAKRREIQWICNRSDLSEFKVWILWRIEIGTIRSTLILMRKREEEGDRNQNIK